MSLFIKEPNKSESLLLSGNEFSSLLVDAEINYNSGAIINSINSIVELSRYTQSIENIYTILLKIDKIEGK